MGPSIELTSSGGLMKLSLPQDQPGLSLDKTYLWQVALLCSPDYPSQDIVARAAIKVVPSQSSLDSKIAAPSLSIPEKTDLYARSGLWYDALGSALSGSGQALVLGEAGSKLLADLVNYEERQLAHRPAPAEQEEIATWAQQLRQLIHP
ncbi:MAG: DUF928 domain-containing protein [Chloroflexaceae bacterium]|nr:DUF928 domain-containing protein [Chloroflexaceae bacterium]